MATNVMQLRPEMISLDPNAIGSMMPKQREAYVPPAQVAFLEKAQQQEQEEQPEQPSEDAEFVVVRGDILSLNHRDPHSMKARSTKRR